MKYIIRFLRPVRRNTSKWNPKEEVIVELKLLQPYGNIERHGEDSSMEGGIDTGVVVEFENGEVHTFILDYEVTLTKLMGWKLPQ